MAASSYDASLRRLLLSEGGYSNHPSDPGGPTNFGITIADYRKYVKPNATAADVKAMKVEEAKAIYRARYWDAQRCDELPAGVDYAVFDYGVSSGIGRSKRVLQRVVGVEADGAFGPVTMAAVAAHDPKKVVTDLCDERLRFLQTLKTWKVFSKGWSRRVAEVRAAAMAMAAGVAAPAEAPTRSVARAVVPCAKTARPVSTGVAIASGAAAAIEAHRLDAPTEIIIALLLIALLAALLAWLSWAWLQKHRPLA
jgi:lysozyme family protein